MKKLLYLLLCAALFAGCGKDSGLGPAEDDPENPGNETLHFDPAFAKLLQEKGYVADSNNISYDEVKSIDRLDIGGTHEGWIAGKGLTSLAGIEYFKGLTYLNCVFNQLTSLNVSGCTALTTLNCGSNQLTSLDVSRNTALTELSCGFNELTSLDVSGSTALTVLWCESNQLTSLDVSKNTALTGLFCMHNQLASLDVSRNTALTGLSCESNQLTSLDVSKNTALTGLSCESNQLTSLDVSKNTVLTGLFCMHNQLASLDVSRNTALTVLFCFSNQLTSLDVSRNTALTELFCYYNPGDREKFFPVTAWFGNNNIPENMIFSYGDEKNDGRSWTYDGKTITLDFRKAGNETLHFDPAFAKLLQEKGYVADCNKISYDEVKRIDSLNISGTHEGWIAGKGLTSLAGIEYFKGLTYLNCVFNQLTSLNVSGCTALTTLNCGSNQLTSLNVSGCTALTTLNCGSNQLTSLDVSRNTALIGLFCMHNQLASLDVSRNTALTVLFCFSNQLTSLDVSRNTALTELFCYYNPGDREKFLPVTAWFGNNNIPEYMIFSYGDEKNDGRSWTYGGKTITLDFRKAD